MPLFAIVLIFLVFLILLMIAGIGIGFFLHWIMPSVELGSGMLTGVAAIGLSLYYTIRLLSAVRSYADSELEEDPLRTFRRRRSSRRVRR